MRPSIILLTTMAMMLLMATSVAMAAKVNCPDSGRCPGTNSDDYLVGTAGNNTIVGYNGTDVMFGYGGTDDLIGGTGDDRMYGSYGNDVYNGGPNADRMVDSSKSSNDTYFGFLLPLVTESSAAGRGYDQVYDFGGSDLLDVSTLNRSQVRISWVDTSDADVNRDALRVQQKGTGNVMFFYNYFDNKGGTGQGVGAIEAIRYKNLRDHRFPTPQG